MTCLALGANPAIWEVLWCALELAAGSAVFASIVLFVLMLYGMYQMKVPFMVQVPIGVFVLFVFAGAGNISHVVGGFSSFTTMMWFVLFMVGIVTVLVFWKLRR